MTTLFRCDRCGRVNPPDEHCTWLTLKVSRSEDGFLAMDQIDLCQGCERDMVEWMAQGLVDSIGRK